MLFWTSLYVKINDLLGQNIFSANRATVTANAILLFNLHLHDFTIYFSRHFILNTENYNLAILNFLKNIEFPPSTQHEA